MHIIWNTKDKDDFKVKQEEKNDKIVENWKNLVSQYKYLILMCKPRIGLKINQYFIWYQKLEWHIF